VVGRNTGTDTWSLIRLRGFRNLSELDEFDRKSPKADVRRINDYLSRGPRYFGAGEPSDQRSTGMTIVTGSYRRKVDVAGERMGDPLKPAAHVEIWSYATNGIT